MNKKNRVDVLKDILASPINEKSLKEVEWSNVLCGRLEKYRTNLSEKGYTPYHFFKNPTEEHAHKLLIQAGIHNTRDYIGILYNILKYFDLFADSVLNKVSVNTDGESYENDSEESDSDSEFEHDSEHERDSDLEYDSEASDSEYEYDSEESDSEASDAEESDSEASDSEASDSEKSDSDPDYEPEDYNFDSEENSGMQDTSISSSHEYDINEDDNKEIGTDSIDLSVGDKNVSVREECLKDFVIDKELGKGKY